MDRDEIMALVGRELDAAIARMLGWKITWPVDNGCDWSAGVSRAGVHTRLNYGIDPADGKEKPIPFFSRREVMWLVVDHLQRLDADGRPRDVLSLTYQSGWREPYEKFFWVAQLRISGVFAEAETAPVAICQAALLSVMAREIRAKKRAEEVRT